MATMPKLKPGQIVWNIRRHRMGNTTARTISVYQIRVIEVHADHVIASWNGNRPEAYREREVRTWKVKEPITVKTWGGMGARLATREEIKKMQEPPNAQ